jgi:PAS domain S-box-containing protein
MQAFKVGNAQDADSLSFLKGSGEMAGLIRAFEWSGTALGPIEGWPQSLKTTTGILLLSPVPIVLLWGREGYMIYNDAYSVFADGRHPAILGSEVRDGWEEVAEFNDHVMKVVLAGGTLSYRDQPLTLNRNGAPEPAWLNLDYSPVLGERGEPEGVIAIVVETTERVLGEQRTAAELERQLHLVQQMPGFVGILRGPNHVYEYVNDAYTAMSGPRNFLGRPVREVFPELADQGFFQLLDNVYATGVRYVARGVPISLEGETQARFIDLLYEPIRDEQDRISGIFVGGYDASEIYRSAAALKQSEARLRLVVESATDHAILTIAVDATITSWSAGAQSLFGWKAEEIVGQSFARLFDVNHDDADAHLRALAAAQHGSSSDERWHIRKDGRRIFMNVSLHPLRSADLGAQPEFLMIARDETARRRTDDALRSLMQALETRIAQRTYELHESMNFARLALSAVGGVGVWTYDPASDQFSCDAAVAKLYDIDAGQAEEGLPRPAFFQHVHPDDAEAVARTLAGVLVTGSPLELEYRLCHRDGSLHWVLSRGHTSFDESGRATRLVGVGVDMTKQRLLEEQFRQSQKMEAVGQLTGGLAHDFNNLLTGISGSLELLQARLAQGNLAGSERYVTAAQGAARRAAALTHRLLAFSRRQTLDPKPTDVNRLVQDMEELIRRTVGPEITMEVVGAAGLWSTYVDSNQLENALLNLCINARDAMPHGGRLTIETANKWLDERAASERDMKAGQYVSLCVTDTGTGMTPEVISRAFDPFFTTKPMGEGTGLGLSMIYGFVRQSGGQVRIYSELGEGTTMCIYLPRADAGPQDPVPTSLDDEPEFRGSGQVVLVVDDEPTVRMLIRDVLEETGYAAIEAGDGPSSMSILRSTARIDLLITDVGLPGGMNGRQIADAARVFRRDLKVLFITGYAENAVIGNGHLERGMQILTKPFAIDALAERIRAMLDES